MNSSERELVVLPLRQAEAFALGADLPHEDDVEGVLWAARCPWCGADFAAEAGVRAEAVNLLRIHLASPNPDAG